MWLDDGKDDEMEEKGGKLEELAGFLYTLKNFQIDIIDLAYNNVTTAIFPRHRIQNGKMVTSHSSTLAWR